jgi:hypothetical protein
MPLLENASVDQIRRLLDLFPSSLIKEQWPGVKGEKKVDACEIIAKTQDAERFRKFLVASFAYCRQHVLLLKNGPDGSDFRAAFPATDLLATAAGGISFHLAAVPYTVYLLDPMEQTTVNVLWPLRFEVRDDVVIARSVVLERDPGNFTGRQSIKSTRELDEKRIPFDLAKLGYDPLDINKGVKALWTSKYMDAFRVSYKKRNSTSTEVMDEEVGLRDNAPEIFEQLTSKPLLNTNFKPDPSVQNAIGIFQINASMGRLGFTSYAENPGDSDAIIEAILENNK